jgi:hypothetical protein
MGGDPSVELDKVRACVDQITDGCATEAKRLSRQVTHEADILIDLGLLPIKDIPQLPKIAKEV